MKNEQTPLNILIIGANGGIGRQTVLMALEAGHKVTAMVRSAAKLALTHPNLQVVTGDIWRPETFKQYLAGKDAVISAIGEQMDKPTTLYSEGNANLLMAMRDSHEERYFQNPGHPQHNVWMQQHGNGGGDRHDNGNHGGDYHGNGGGDHHDNGNHGGEDHGHGGEDHGHGGDDHRDGGQR